MKVEFEIANYDIVTTTPRKLLPFMIFKESIASTFYSRLRQKKKKMNLASKN